MAVLAIAVAGAGVGGAIGGALGASIGWAVGSYIGQVLFAPNQVVEGPRLRDMTIPAGAEGAGIPKAYGTVRVRGEVIWSDEIRETVVETEVDTGGKGGPSTTQRSYFYSLTWAVSLHDGEITGVRRIWMDSKLVFSVGDGADPATFAANTAHGGITIHRGTEEQVADPTIAAFVGAANTPGHRGIAYIVFTNWALADFANHRPHVEAEIVVAGPRTYPNYAHTVSGNAFDLVAVDPRRTRVLYAYVGPFGEGQPIYQWTAGSQAPTAFGVIGDGLAADVLGVAVDVAQDEVVLFAGYPGIPRFVRWNAATGVRLAQGSINVGGLAPGLTEDETVECRSRLHFDPNEQVFWTTGDGFSTGDLYLVRFSSPISTADTFWLDTGGNSSAHNHNDLIDSDGRVWIVTTDALIRCGVPWELYAHPGDGFDPPGSFLWAARGEIWIPRGSNHTTSGWYVFNLSTSTFSNSVTLFGDTWSANWIVGVENAYGQAWFVERGITGVDGEMRNADGTLEKSFDDEWSQAQEVESLLYMPGVLVMNTQSTAACFYEDSIAKATWTLEDVVTAVCNESGVTAVNATDLRYDTVRGAVRTRPMPARAFLEPFFAAYSFDGYESSAQAKFVKRGGPSVLTLADDDLGCFDGNSSGENVEALTRTRGEETELPATIYVSFLNDSLDYNVGVARSRRLVVGSTNILQVELPIVFNSEEGHQISDNLMRYGWLERERYQFSLGPQFRMLEPTDVVTLPNNRRVRVTRISYSPNGPLDVEAVSDDQGAPISYAVGNENETGTGETLGTSGPTTGIVLDIPLLVDTHDDEGIYLAAGSEDSEWPGALWMVSKDNGATYQTLAPVSTASRIGYVTAGTMSASADPTKLDHVSTLTVQMLNPAHSLESAASLLSFWNGANAFAISNDGENWEICQFLDVVDNGGGSFTLTNFTRGRKGTEWAVSAWTAGATFVLLQSSQIIRVKYGANNFGSTGLFKAVTTGKSLDDEIADEESFDAISAKPYSPVHVLGNKVEGGAWSIRWTRRARSKHRWLSTYGAPLDEPTESYAVEIWDEDFTGLVRTLDQVDDATETSYSNANAVSDFGIDPFQIGVKVYQISNRVGRGYAGTGVITESRPGGGLSFSSSLKTSGFTLSNGNKTCTRGGSSFDHCPTNHSQIGGKWYWEISADSIGSNSDIYLGITNQTSFTQSAHDSTNWCGQRGTGTAVQGTSNGPAITTGDVWCAAWDADQGKLWLGELVSGQPSWSSGNPATDTSPNCTYTAGTARWRPIVWSDNVGAAFTVTGRFTTGHQGTPPSGFSPIG